jgi:hypothetical protein
VSDADWELKTFLRDLYEVPRGNTKPAGPGRTSDYVHFEYMWRVFSITFRLIQA